MTAPTGSGDLAMAFDGQGRSFPLDPSEAIEAFARPGLRAGPVWLHCHISSRMLAALQRSGAIDQLVHEQLAMEESRPRCIPHGEGILLNLRARAADGIEDERELVAIRCWITPAGMVTAWRRPATAAAALLEEAGRGGCPATCGDMVASLCLHVADSIEPMVDELSDKIDELELELLDMTRAARRKELAALRRKAIEPRRVCRRL